MPTTPPEKSVAKPAEKPVATPADKPVAKPVAKPAPAKKAATSTVKATAVKKAASKPAKTPSVAPAETPTPAPVPQAAAKPASKPTMPTRRRSKPTSRAPVKPRTPLAAKPVASAKPIVKRVAVVAAGTSGVLAAIGAAFFLWRASKADQPDYKLVERDGDFEIREYPGLVTAATEARGPRDAALERGFTVLADYIFAKSRRGEKIAMTAPVLSDGSSTSGWRTRFIMPAGKARADLPAPPSGVTLANEPPRRVAAVRFGGRAKDADLAAKEGALRSWLQLRAFPSEGRAEHAFYNSPVMPGPLRRNEVLITLSTK
jgi:hypothetical protein